MADELSVSNVKEQISSNDECEKSTLTPTNTADAKPLTDAEVISFGDSSPDSNLNSISVNTETILNALKPSSEVLENVSLDIQDMEVEEQSEEKETCVDVPCVDTAASLQKEEEMTAISQLSSTKVILTSAQLQSDDIDAVPDGLPNEVNGLDLTQQLMNVDQHLPSTDESFPELPCGDQANEQSLSKGTEPVKLEGVQITLPPDVPTVEEISESTENQNSDIKHQDEESFCLQIVEVNSGASCSDDEPLDDVEFNGLKRKVRVYIPDPNSVLRDSNSAGVKSPLDRQTLDQAKRTNSVNSKSEEEEPLDICEAVLNTESEPVDDSSDSNVLVDNLVNSTLLENNSVMNVQQEASVENKHTLELSEFSQNSLQTDDTLNGQAKNEPFGPQDNDTRMKVNFVKADDANSNPWETCQPCSTVQNAQTLADGNKVGAQTPFATLVSREALGPMPSPESLGRVRMEMGPPLPPVVMPLTATPPKFIRHHTPVRSCLRPHAWLPSEGQLSLKQQPTASPSRDSYHPEDMKTTSCLNTPSPTSGVPSSPLQFGSATPKHAVPVPGRLPSSALNSPSSGVSQENSMQMLDTMYPELSAQARTLNILRGNVNLGRSGVESGVEPPSVSQISGNKTINSSSTAFTKTEQKPKRRGPNVLLPKSAKKLRLDACSPSPANNLNSPVTGKQPTDADELITSHPGSVSSNHNHEQDTDNKTEVQCNDKQMQISDAFEKLKSSCFSLMPVIRSHLYIGRISQIPALTDEEKFVISQFCSDQSTVEEFMSAVLTKMKSERTILKQEFLQSLCRVYVGLCRQRRDQQKAQALAYSILKEGFPEAPTLILFIVVTWPSVLQHDSSLVRAIHIVSKLKADKETLACLSTYLHWDERPPGDIYQMIRSTLKAIREDEEQKFQKHDRRGEDLCPTAWEYIFTLDLLCAHLGWTWTHDNIIGKQLWPTMNDWVTQSRHQQSPVRNVTVATVLRLIGRLSQMGFKENFSKSVQNIGKAINLFCKHGITEGVPWEVQLCAIYAVYDLAPSNPKEALEALASWRGETNQVVPQAVTSCITRVGFLCRQIKS